MSERADAKFIPLDSARPPMTRRPETPGEWRFLNENYEPCAPPEPGKVARLDFACIKRPGDHCGALVVGNRFKPPNGTWGSTATWHWNGSLDEPTLHPSINCLDRNPMNPQEKYAGCGWHAWLTKGVFGDR